MGSIAIVVDSTAGMTEAYAQEHGVSVIPLMIQMQGESLREGIDITADAFYARIVDCDPLPTTSQPSAGEFLALYRRLVEAGAEGIVSIHLSSGISGTVNSATLAAADLQSCPVVVVDAQSAATSALFATEAAVRSAEAGTSLDHVAKAAQDVLDAQRTLFAVGTLEYLHKGGRIGGAAALFGSLLQVKPLLYFQDGRIDSLEKVRTTAKALSRTVELMAEWMGSDTPVIARVIHAASPERAEKLMDMAKARLNVVEMRVGEVSPVLGAHTGPGTVSLCCCPAAAAGLT